MTELRDVLERAERAVASLSIPPDGFEQLRRYQRRRQRNHRVLAGLVAIVVASGGTFGSLAYLRALHHSQPQQAAGNGGQHTSPTPVPVPTGPLAQRVIGGGPAQRLGPYWFGLTDESSCLKAGPLTIGPSWTLQDDGHDCVGPLGSDSMVIGQSHGAVHRDGDSGAPTRFNAVYGLSSPEVRRIDVTWAGGGVASLTPVNGQFIFVWSQSAWPLHVTAISAGGKELATIDLIAA
jgi:hypothetical protein